MEKEKLIDAIIVQYAKLRQLHPMAFSPGTVVREELREKLAAQVSKLSGCQIIIRPDFVTIADYAELVIRTRYQRRVELKLRQVVRNVFGIQPGLKDVLEKQWLTPGHCEGKVNRKHFYAIINILLGVPRDRRWLTRCCTDISEIAEFAAFELWKMRKRGSI